MDTSQLRAWLAELVPQEIDLLEEIQYLTQEVEPLQVLELILLNLDLVGQRVQALHPQIPCASGCFACCQESEPELYPVEMELLQEMYPEAVAELRLQKPLESSAGCLFLAEGRCQVYAARPVSCRAKGLAFYQEEMKRPQEAARPWTCASEKERIEWELEQTSNPIRYMYMPLLNQYFKLVARIDGAAKPRRSLSAYFSTDVSASDQ